MNFCARAWKRCGEFLFLLVIFLPPGTKQQEILFKMKTKNSPLKIHHLQFHPNSPPRAEKFTTSEAKIHHLQVKNSPPRAEKFTTSEAKTHHLQLKNSPPWVQKSTTEEEKFTTRAQQFTTGSKKSTTVEEKFTTRAQKLSTSPRRT